jgi:hypothetical protein
VEGKELGVSRGNRRLVADTVFWSVVAGSDGASVVGSLRYDPFYVQIAIRLERFVGTIPSPCCTCLCIEYVRV